MDVALEFKSMGKTGNPTDEVQDGFIDKMPGW